MKALPVITIKNNCYAIDGNIVSDFTMRKVVATAEHYVVEGLRRKAIVIFPSENKFRYAESILMGEGFIFYGTKKQLIAIFGLVDSSPIVT